MKISNFPIYVIAGFNLFTLGMYLSSPYIFYGGGFWLCAEFIFINIVAVILGYYKGVSSGKRKVSLNRAGGGRSIRQIFLYLTVFYALTFLIKYAYIMRFDVFDVGGMVGQLLIGVANPKLGYSLSIDTSRQPTVSWSLYFFISILNGVYFIVGFLSWNRVGRGLRVLFLLFLAIEVFYWVGRGTNFGIVSLIVALVLSRVVDSKGRTSVISLLVYGALVVVALVSFSLIMYSRSGGDVEDLQTLSIPWCDVDEGSVFFDIFPQRLHSSLLTVFSYLVQGYYNTALAFNLDFKPSWFGGWNPSIELFYSVFGFDVANSTYVQRLEVYGIDPRVNWHSSYTWFANDVSFFGVPFVMFAIGYLIGVSWVKSVMLENDLLSRIVFVLLASSVIFSFANNNFIGYSFYSFMFILPYWMKKNNKIGGRVMNVRRPNNG